MLQGYSGGITGNHVGRDRDILGYVGRAESRGVTHALPPKDSTRGQRIRSLNSRENRRGARGNGYHLGSTFGNGTRLSNTLHLVRNTLWDINSGCSEHRGFEIFLPAPFNTLNCLSSAWQHLDDERTLLDGSIGITLGRKCLVVRRRGEQVFLNPRRGDNRDKTTIVLSIAKILYIPIAKIYWEVSSALISWLNGGRFRFEQQSRAFLGQFGLGEASLGIGVYRVGTWSQAKFSGIQWVVTICLKHVTQCGIHRKRSSDTTS